MDKRAKLKRYPLGHVQQEWLLLLYERRDRMWYQGCGFEWDGIGRTITICFSLVARGLMADVGMVKGPFGHVPAWKLTAAGEAQAKKILEERDALNRPGSGQGE